MKFLALQALRKSGPDPASQQQPTAEKGGTVQGPPNPQFTADLPCCACTLPTLASRRDAPEPGPYQGRPGRAIGSSTRTHQSFATSCFGLIFRPYLFTPCVFRAACKEVTGNTPKHQGGQQHGGLSRPAPRVAEFGAAFQPTAEAKQPAGIL